VRMVSSRVCRGLAGSNEEGWAGMRRRGGKVQTAHYATGWVGAISENSLTFMIVFSRQGRIARTA